MHYSSGCEDCSSFTSLGWLPGILVLNTSHLYPHHPQTYAPLPAPLPRGPLPYPGLYAGKMPPTTPMMLPTQHTFAFTPRVPPGWASVAPGQHQQRGQTAQLGQLGPQIGIGYPIPQFPVTHPEQLSSSVRRAPSTFLPPGNAQAGPSSGVRFVEQVPQPQPRKPPSKPAAGKTYEVVPCEVEEISCAIRVTDAHTRSQRACGAVLRNNPTALLDHFAVHQAAGQNPSCIAECPFPKKVGPGGRVRACGGTKGGAAYNNESYKRHVVAAHFVKKERFMCLTCGRDFARPDKLKKGHKCDTDGEQGGGGATAPTAIEAQEGGVVDESAVAGPSGSREPDSEIHDSRPSKRPRTAR